MNESLTKIFWADPNGRDERKNRFMLVTEVTDILVGRNTPEFERIKVEDAFFDNSKQQEQLASKSFTIVGPTDRSLHLEVPCPGLRVSSLQQEPFGLSTALCFQAPNKAAAQHYMRSLRFMMICKGCIPEDHEASARFIED